MREEWNKLPHEICADLTARGPTDHKITIKLRTSDMGWFYELMHDTTMTLYLDEGLEWAFVKMEEEE